MIIQIMWLFFVYFAAGLIGNPAPQKFSGRKKDRYFIKSILAPVLVGLIGVFSTDWLSDGNPLWPALGLVSGVSGALFLLAPAVTKL